MPSLDKLVRGRLNDEKITHMSSRTIPRVARHRQTGDEGRGPGPAYWPTVSLRPKVVSRCPLVSRNN